MICQKSPTGWVSQFHFCLWKGDQTPTIKLDNLLKIAIATWRNYPLFPTPYSLLPTTYSLQNYYRHSQFFHTQITHQFLTAQT